MPTENDLQRTDLIGTWLDPEQARADTMRGNKMAGSAACHGPKWRLKVTSTGPQVGTFQLSARSGYDHRGQMSSSGLTDGKVDLTVYRAHGTWTAAQGCCTRLHVPSARTIRTHGTTSSGLLSLPGLPEAPLEDDVEEHVIAEHGAFVVTVERQASGQLALRAEELNAAAPVLLVPAPLQT